MLSRIGSLRRAFGFDLLGGFDREGKIVSTTSRWSGPD
jgi:hypothetical protein